MQRANQTLELVALMIVFIGCGIAGIRRKEADRVIAPVVHQRFAVVLTHIAGLVKFEDRHQLNGVDTELLEVRNFFHYARKGAREPDAGGRMTGKAAHMHLINDQIGHRNMRLDTGAPVKIMANHTRTVRISALAGAPDALTGNRLGIRIKQQIFPVEQIAFLRIVRSVDPIGIFNIFNVQTEYDHGVGRTDLVVLREGQLNKRLLLLAVEQNQPHGSRTERADGKIDAARYGSRAIIQPATRTHIVSVQTVCWRKTNLPRG